MNQALLRSSSSVLIQRSYESSASPLVLFTLSDHPTARLDLFSTRLLRYLQRSGDPTIQLLLHSSSSRSLLHFCSSLSPTTRSHDSTSSPLVLFALPDGPIPRTNLVSTSYSFSSSLRAPTIPQFILLSTCSLPSPTMQRSYDSTSGRDGEVDGGRDRKRDGSDGRKWSDGLEWMGMERWMGIERRHESNKNGPVLE